MLKIESSFKTVIKKAEPVTLRSYIREMSVSILGWDIIYTDLRYLIAFLTFLIGIFIKYLNEPKNEGMGGACGTCGRENRCTQVISGEAWG